MWRLNFLEFQDAIFTFPRTFRRAKVANMVADMRVEKVADMEKDYWHGGGQGGRHGGRHGGDHDDQHVAPLSRQSPMITSIVSMQPDNMKYNTIHCNNM